MAKGAGSVVVKITGDTKGLSGALNEAEGKLGKFGGAMGNIMKAGALAGGAAVIGFGVKAVQAFAEAEQVAAQTAAVLKSTGGVAKVSAKDVDTLASSLSKMSGVDDEAIASGQNLLLTFTKVRNETGKGNDIFNQATKAALNMSVAMGTDMTSASMLMGKALNDPIKGMTALTRSGVSFTEAQKDQVKAMVASGDTMGAQKLILKEMETQFGGSAKAAGETFSGQLNKLKVTIGNFMEDAGAKLVPILMKVGDWLGKKIPEAIEFLRPTFDLIVTGVKGFVLALKDGDVTSDGFVGVMETIGDALRRAIPVIKDIVTNGFKLLSNWWEHWGPTIVSLAKTVWEGFQTLARIATEVVTTVIDHWKKIEPIIKAVAAVVLTVLIPQWVAAGVAATVNAAKQVVAWVTTQVAAVKASVIHTIEIGKMIAGWVRAGVQAGINAAVVVAGWLATGAAAIAQTAVAVAQFGIQVAKWAWMGAMALAGAAQVALAWVISMGPIAAVVAAVIGAVILIVKNWDTIKAAAAAVWEWVRDKFNALVGFVTGLPKRISSVASGMFDGIKDAFRGALNWVIDRWNGLEFKMPGFEAFGQKVGGFTIGLPDIPKFHDGGVVPGRPGQEVLSLLEAGERVIPRNGAGAGMTFNIQTQADPSQIADEVSWLMRTRGL